MPKTATQGVSLVCPPCGRMTCRNCGNQAHLGAARTWRFTGFGVRVLMGLVSERRARGIREVVEGLAGLVRLPRACFLLCTPVSSFV